MKAGRISTLAVLVCAMTLVLQSTASAIIFKYLEGPNTGQTYLGPVIMTLLDYGMGTSYPSNPLGATIDGEANMDAYQTTGATGALTATNSGLGNGLEDNWGIAKISRIETPSGAAVWLPTANDHLFAMFYGLQDFHLTQDAGDERLFVDGKGLRVDMWETSTDTWLNAPFGPQQGSAGRTGTASYNGVTTGNLVLSLASRSNFLNPAGFKGGLATEFETQFSDNPINGLGMAYMDVVGGSQAADFNSDSFATPVSLDLANGGVGAVTNADLFLNWDIKPNALVNEQTGQLTDWFEQSKDPALANITPEPATIIIWTLLGVMGLTVGWRRRRA